MRLRRDRHLGSSGSPEVVAFVTAPAGPCLPPPCRHNATPAVLLGFRENPAATRSATGPATILQRGEPDRDRNPTTVDSHLPVGCHGNIPGTAERPGKCSPSMRRGSRISD